MESISKTLVLFLMLEAFTMSTCRLCRLEISASSWVQKPCVFFFGNETKTKFIGAEFRLKDDVATKETFQVIEANFNKFLKSPLTLWNHSCDCAEVPCLNEEQLNNLFAYSVEQAREEAIVRFPFLPRLCCSLQQVLEEIFYSLQTKDIDKLMKITSEEISIHNWVAYLSYELQQIEWCKTFKAKCQNVIHRMAEGCKDKRRERRDIGFKTTTTCPWSSCFQGKEKIIR